MQVTLLDDAIKNVILKHPVLERRVYSRLELLDLKKSCKDYEPPVFNIDRFIKGKNGKNLIFLGQKHDKFFFSSCGAAADKNRRDCFSLKLQRGSSFQSLKHIGGIFNKKGLRDKRAGASELEECQFDSLEKPPWFTEGPKNVDDQIDFADMKMPQFYDQAICKIGCTDASRKTQHQEKALDKSNSLKTLEFPDTIACDPFANASSSGVKAKQKPIQIYTLREIENELHVRKNCEENSKDLSAFNKLLELVGLRVRDSQQQELLSDSATLNFDKAVNRGDSKEHEKVSLQALDQKESVCSPKNYNGCMTRYPAHLFNQASIGHTFRWFRAMTNAASASAFICQRMDSINSFDSEAQRNAQDSVFIGQHDSLDSSYVDVDDDQIKEIIQPMDGYDCVSHGVPLCSSMGFSVGAVTNRLGSRFFNPMEYQNGNKFLMRQPLQPFLLQQIFQQQQLAKYSALQLLNLRSSTMGLLPGYQQAQLHPFLQSHLTNSNAVNYSICNHTAQHHQQQTTTTATAVANGTGEGTLTNPDTSSPEFTSQMVGNKYGEGFSTTTQELEC